MSGIIARTAYADVTLLVDTGQIEDGRPLYAKASAKGMIFDFAQCDFVYFGQIKNGKIVLLAPGSGIPTIPGRLMISGVSYDIQGIKTYRSMRGEIIGYRVAVAASGGSK